MSQQKAKVFRGSLYLSTKDGMIKECQLGSGGGCSVPLEAGEFFYHVQKVYALVKCNSCKSFQIAYFDKSTCKEGYEKFIDYEDHMDFVSKTNCNQCGNHMSVHLFAVWYNGKVDFFKHHVKNCSLMELKGADKILKSLLKDRISPSTPAV